MPDTFGVRPLYELMLYVPTNILAMRITCIVQGHNTVPSLRLEPETPRPQSEHSTTLSMRSFIK